jgi:hypothetical protein
LEVVVEVVVEVWLEAELEARGGIGGLGGGTHLACNQS